MIKQCRSSGREKCYTVRDAVFDFFATIGVDTIFGNPGSTELPMFRNFPDHFRYILGLQEATVVGMADGFAQATGKASLVNLHSAAGVGNAMGNIFTAYKNQTPMIITAGQQARSILPFDPFLASIRPTELAEPYVKWAVEPARAEDVPLAIQRAFNIAMTEPRGPVLVSVPVDDWDRQRKPLAEHRMFYSQRPSADAIMALSCALEERKCPAFVVGGGVDRARASDLVVKLAEHYQAQIYVAPMSGRCSFPEDHYLFNGFLPARREKIVDILGHHDLIIVLGASAFLYHVEGFGPFIPEQSELFQIVDNPFTASWTPTGTSIVGNVRLALEELLAVSKPLERAKKQAKKLPRTGLSAKPQSSSNPRLSSNTLTTAFVLQTLHGLENEDWFIVEEAPSARSLIQKFLPISKPGQFLTMESGGLGYGMPAAVGSALALPDKKIIAIIGDGSALYSVQSLWTAAVRKLSITWIVLRNGSYAALEEFAPEFGFKKHEKVVGTTLSGIDFAGMAKGFGINAKRIVDCAELERELQDATASSSPTLFEVVVSDIKNEPV